MAEVVRSEAQAELISSELGIPFNKVDLILKSYRKYVRYMIEQGESMVILSAVEIYESGTVNTLNDRTTFAYQISVVANELGESRTLVEGVLNHLRYLMVHGISKLGLGYNIFTLVTLNNEGGKLKLRSSSRLPAGYRVRSLPRFREEINGAV